MLPLSDLTIKLNQSKDYQKCAVLLHLLALIVVFRAGIPLLLKMLLGIILLVFFIHSIRKQSNFCQLSYDTNHWLLSELNGRQLKYQYLTIIFDGGIFSLVKVKGLSPSKTLVIFHDQLTEQQYRILKFSSKET